MFAQTIMTLLLGTLWGGPAVDSRIADAAMQGDKAAVQTLISRKADINAAQGDGMTALHWAAYRNDIDVARLLIQAGANIKATTRLGDYTPFLIAAKTGSAAVMDLLLKTGADVNATNPAGTTALMLASGS